MSEQDKRAEEVRVTGGYEPNDPVVLSREEYAAALAQARREGYREGVEAMRDAVVREKDVTPQDEARTNVIAARLLSKGGTDG